MPLLTACNSASAAAARFCSAALVLFIVTFAFLPNDLTSIFVRGIREGIEGSSQSAHDLERTDTVLTDLVEGERQIRVHVGSTPHVTQPLCQRQPVTSTPHGRRLQASRPDLVTAPRMCRRGPDQIDGGLVAKYMGDGVLAYFGLDHFRPFLSSGTARADERAQSG